MDAIGRCKICGCTETNLIDGFYYCVECGTQDTNIQETIIESVFLDDGAHAIASKKRITQIPQTNEVQMTDDWYKWHSLNFLLKGLADELIELGAAPSFKTKLLWIWTRYMKKYLNNADFGLTTNEELDENKEDKPASDESEFSSDEEETYAQRKKNKMTSKIKNISMPLVITFLYVALNLDKSRFQLSHLIRFAREERISILQWQKLVPKELRPKKLRLALLYDRKSFKYSSSNVRVLALQLFQNLDLGNPIVPDLRPLVDEYMQELCLPNDLKPLVISLMHCRSFHYLDTNVQYKTLVRLPSYELYVISHILMALKICFGLDGLYEEIISDTVDKINDLDDFPKSHANSEPSERLFSFRDWCSYVQFRKCLLRTHTLHLGSLNYFDMNDYVASEHQKERPDHKITFINEITLDILRKMPRVEPNVIPRNEFVATTTPHTTYSKVIAENIQDSNVKLLLTEDFTQYSLKYILEDMFLVDPDSPNPRNILTGLCESSVRDTGTTNDFILHSLSFRGGHVYVKDCDNHNWTKTQRPQLQHITQGENNNCSEKENYNEYESESGIPENVRKVSDVNLNNNVRKNSINLADDKNITEKHHNGASDIEMDIDIDEKCENIVIEDVSITDIDNKSQLLVIKEEDEDRHIFDDDFLDLETKKDDENVPETIDNEAPMEESERLIISDDIYGYTELTQNNFQADEDSDASSIDSIRLNPKTLNRNDATKELVIHACTKYRIPIPGKFIQHRYHKKTKRTRKPVDKSVFDRRAASGETTKKVLGLISAYQSHLQSDIFHQMSNMVQSAIANFNESHITGEPSEIPLESGDALQDYDEMNNDPNDMPFENELNNTNREPDQNKIPFEEYNLFSDSSDGETHAEELLPKKNPEYDEATHDIKQLYIKPVDNPETAEMDLNPKLAKIVEQQIKAEENDLSLLERTENKDEDSDSEEEVTLSLLQEQKRIRQQLSAQERNTKQNRLKKLFRSTIPSYKYWVRHYNNRMTNEPAYFHRFAREIRDIFPDSFVFVLKECADVVGHPPYTLYKGLQQIELFLKHKYVNRKRFSSSYFSRVNKKSKTKDF